MRPLSVAACAGALLTLSCQPRPAEPAPTVRIAMPGDGATVTGTAVHVMLEVTGVELAPVAEQRAGTAHHHLYLDTDLGAPDQAIPVGLPGVIHLGLAQTEFHWDSVAPGPHRIIAVLADPAHVPLRPLVVDTVHFTVAPPAPPPPAPAPGS